MNRIMAALAIAGLLAGPVLAQDNPAFADLDTDMNGALSFAEVTTEGLTVTQDQFDQADANGDDVLSEEEYTVLLGLATGSADTTPGSNLAAPTAPATPAN